MTKKYVLLLLIVTSISKYYLIEAQSSYTYSNYASSGDSLFLTLSQDINGNYDTTGAGIIWSYDTIAGISQRELIFRTPAQAGVAWTYVLNPMNANLSSTDNKTITFGSFQYTDPNDFYLKNSSVLRQSASSAKLIVGNVPVTIKNQYTTPDVILKFPLNYGNADSSESSYTTTITDMYYRKTNIKRVNNVTGWGTIVTPFSTFSNCLKLESTVRQIDSIVVDTLPPFVDTIFYKEYKWFDASKKYQVFYVKQLKILETYVTEIVEYLDSKHYFQPVALFSYLPLAPIAGEEVFFQNLSVNSESYFWDFGNPESGTNNSSSSNNPSHVFINSGVYQVKLIAYNGSLTDTVILPVSVDTIPTASFSYNPLTIYAGETVHFTNNSINANNYIWNFGNPESGNLDTSYLTNPVHIYSNPGTYIVTLVAVSSAGSDTTQTTLVVSQTVNIYENYKINIDVITNPFVDFIRLKNSSIFDEFQLTNDCGKLIWKGKYIENHDFSAIPAGIYILKAIQRDCVECQILIKQ